MAARSPTPRYGTRTLTRARVNLVLVVYLVAGFVLAATQGYFETLGSLRGIVSAVLAVLLWPLLLLGIDLHVRR